MLPQPELTALRVLLLAALTTAVVGCSGPAAEGIPATDAPRWAPGEEWRLSDEPLLTIGAVDGREAIGMVGRIVDQTGVALLGGGRVAFVDMQADEIRIYDASGARIATSGRSGDGPGEFRGVRGIQPFGGDSLLVWDSRAGFFVGRVSVFTTEGTFVRSVPAVGLRIGAVVGVFEDGTTLVQPQTSTPSGWERPASGEYREPRLYQRLAASGEVLDTFGPVPGPESVAMGPTGRTLVYYGRDTYVVGGRRYIYAGDSGRFEISVNDPETGEVVRRVSRPYDPVPVTAEEIAMRRASMREAYARIRVTNQPDPDDTPARETHPVFNRIVEDPEENLWVRHAVTAADSVQTWSVFDGQGSWLGEVDIPIRMSVRAIGSEEIAVVSRDELGVEYVLLFRLIK